MQDFFLEKFVRESISLWYVFVADGYVLSSKLYGILFAWFVISKLHIGWSSLIFDIKIRLNFNIKLNSTWYRKFNFLSLRNSISKYTYKSNYTRSSKKLITIYQIPCVLLIYFLLSNTIDIPLLVPRQFILLFPHKSKNYRENATNLEFKQNPRIPVNIRLIRREIDVYPVRGRILQFTGTRSPDTKVVPNDCSVSLTSLSIIRRRPSASTIEIPGIWFASLRFCATS